MHWIFRIIIWLITVTVREVKVRQVLLINVAVLSRPRRSHDMSDTLLDKVFCVQIDSSNKCTKLNLFKMGGIF